jgi:hypothetical protein
VDEATKHLTDDLGVVRYRLERDGFPASAKSVDKAIVLIQRLAAEVARSRPAEIDAHSEEGFAVRVIREAASRGDEFVIEAQGGRYLARVNSKAALALLADKVLVEKEAARG